MSPPPVATTIHHLDLDLPLANRRCRHVSWMPAKFCDNLPQLQPSGTCCPATLQCNRLAYNTLAATISYDILVASSSPSTLTTKETTHASEMHHSRVLRYFRTTRNLFGLCRKHYRMECPSHDP